MASLVSLVLTYLVHWQQRTQYGVLFCFGILLKYFIIVFSWGSTNYTLEKLNLYRHMSSIDIVCTPYSVLRIDIWDTYVGACKAPNILSINLSNMICGMNLPIHAEPPTCH